MNINRIIGMVALAGLALALTGCVVTSVYPFYFEKDLTFEPALVGDWKNRAQSDEHWKFERASGHGYRIISESRDRTSVLHGQVFKLHGQTFLDLTATERNEEIQPEDVPSHFLVRIVQLRPVLKVSAMKDDWLKALLAKNPKAVRHITIQTGEKPDDHRLVLTADTAELQHFVLKHIETAGAWEPSVELQPDPTKSSAR